MSPILMFKLVNPSVSDATVIIAGISIVVGVLLLLILIFYLFGVIVPLIEAASKKREAKKAAKKAKKTAKKAEQSTKAELVSTIKSNEGVTAVFTVPAPVSPAPVVEQGISGEVVAAIAAAVAATEGQGVVVRSIKRKNVSGRNPWAHAADIDNTRPF